MRVKRQVVPVVGGMLITAFSFFHCIAAGSEKFFAKFAALPFGTFVVTRQVGQVLEVWRAPPR
jgi:hypothetical protein